MVLSALLFFYLLVNFGLTGYLLRHGSAHREADGTYSLRNHGSFVRVLSERDFHRYNAYEARLFSGHWMFFYSMAATMFIASVTDRSRPRETT